MSYGTSAYAIQDRRTGDEAMILYRKARLEVCIRGNDVELWWPGSLAKAITLHQHAEHCPEWEDGDIVTVSVSNTHRKASWQERHRECNALCPGKVAVCGSEIRCKP